MITTKNVCFFAGIVFGFLIYFNICFFIPSFTLLVIGGIQTFEISKKKKNCIEETLHCKLKEYEVKLDNMKKDYNKLKEDLESIKTRISVTQAFGYK